METTITRPLRTKEWLLGFCQRFHEPDLTATEQAALFEHLRPFALGEADADAGAAAMKASLSDWVKELFRKREIRRQEIMCNSPMIFCPLCNK